MDAYEKVKLSRAKGRPTAVQYIQHIFDDFIELHGDRRYADDAAIVGGVAWLGEIPVTVIGIEKGVDTMEKVRRNFGSPAPEGYRKALRLMKQAEKFHRPVFCVVDTSGASCDMGAEERGQGQAIAENLMEMMTLKTPVISLFIGEGGSGGALALAVADQVWMMENAYYSVISPEGCASILWKDSKKVREACQCLHLTAEDMLELGTAERLFPEPEEGLEQVWPQIKEQLTEAFTASQQMPLEELLERRYQRFRKYGHRPQNAEE
jgi:acetyl-CoA carboxylase carboxyl transferase subunit alpha